MEPVITTIAKVTVVGMEYHGQNKNGEITAMWGVFNQKCMAIPHLTGKRAAYGVCFSDEDYGTSGMFRYVVGLSVTEVDALPEGMTACTVPAGRYAVLTHCGTLATLSRTFDYIYGTWLPSSEYRLDVTRPDFEFYDERLAPEVHDHPSLEKWLRQVQARDPGVLCMQRASLLRKLDDGVSGAQFPDVLEWHELRVPLVYRYEPGHAADGVTAVLPLALLDHFPRHLPEWLVPGLLRDKLVALLKGLPKQYRKALVPVRRSRSR